MIGVVAAYLLGTVTLLWLPSLPLWCVVLIMMLSGVALWRAVHRRLVLVFWGAWVLAAIHSAVLLMQQIPQEWQGKDMQIAVRIVDLPQVSAGKTRLIAEPLSEQPAVDFPLPDRIRLSWYRDAPLLQAGDHWNLLVRLKPPHGFANPGSFDLEGWLFAQRIRAVGYVRTSADNQRTGYSITLNRVRQMLWQQLRQRLPESDAAALIPALAFGVRDDIEYDTWDDLRATGTSHLLAISGLHIGLVAGLGFALMNALWRRIPWCCGRYPAQYAAALFSLVPATMYALLAGFSVPTQRALLMLVVVVLALLWRRQLPRSQILAVALLLVLLWDPLAVLSPGFWLSFAAVAILLLLAQQTPKRWLGQLIHMQFWLVLAMAPLTLWWFDQASLVAPLANLLAVPLISLLVMPMLLLAMVLLPWAGVSQPLLEAVLWLLQSLLGFLQVLAGWSGASWALPQTHGSLFLVAAVGMLLLLLRAVPGRELALLWCVPLVLSQPQPHPQGAFEVAFLDVGQGLSVVVLTRDHVLVYDTGDRYSSGFSVAGSVVLPYLAYRDRGVIDTLILSHADRDHAGGADVLRQALPIKDTLTSYEHHWPAADWRYCDAGTQWRWDGVDFRLLHPPSGFEGSENDRSCVLAIESNGQRVLLTGDIGEPAEQHLLRHHADAISAMVMSVPHHGSLTSSSPAFIEAVAPQLAIASLGYHNRFGFPKADVVARYQAQGVDFRRSDASGAVTVRYRPDSGWRWRGFREQQPRLWFSNVAALVRQRLFGRFVGFYDGAHVEKTAEKPAGREQ